MVAVAEEHQDGFRASGGFLPQSMQTRPIFLPGSKILKGGPLISCGWSHQENRFVIPEFGRKEEKANDVSAYGFMNFLLACVSMKHAFNCAGYRN
ncbi:hypothetical protein D915_007796 [Fasciola hepatica]|uniref:Uncharacterized protein n=1 Tax=Fasciola hepatica TaxID=6192 RepID=A0A4E0R4W6_FASHE|nr:hypothetical protein D915_007796 [Fasciola hepatica]